LILDSSGNLYGTTELGGTRDQGVVFELIRCDSAPSGYELKVLYSFTGGADGANPKAGLIRDAVGNLYGTTANGGATTIPCPTSGCGVVFELIRCDSAPSGYDFKLLYSFTGGADGGNPEAGLTQDAAGNLYGTTLSGGTQPSGFNECIAGDFACGVVFKLSPTGTETVLHSFTGPDGANPAAGVIQDAQGNLYGTTLVGGGDVSFFCSIEFGTCGVVFEVTP
jgi:hypothetical protein